MIVRVEPLFGSFFKLIRWFNDWFRIVSQRKAIEPEHHLEGLQEPLFQLTTLIEHFDVFAGKDWTAWHGLRGFRKREEPLDVGMNILQLAVRIVPHLFYGMMGSSCFPKVEVSYPAHLSVSK